MSPDILGTSWDQCQSMVQYSFTSTETRRLVRTDSPGRPPRLSHSSWTIRIMTFTPGWKHRLYTIKSRINLAQFPCAKSLRTLKLWCQKNRAHSPGKFCGFEPSQPHRSMYSTNQWTNRNLNHFISCIICAQNYTLFVASVKGGLSRKLWTFFCTIPSERRRRKHVCELCHAPVWRDNDEEEEEENESMSTNCVTRQ